MTLGPAFGAPPPSDFNEPHDLHREPAPTDPDASRKATSTDATASAGKSSVAPDEEAPKGIRRWLGRLRRSG